MTDLRIERVFAAPVAVVWHAFTDAPALAQWFWPATFGTLATVDLRPGGALRIEAPGRMAVGGEFTTIDAPRALGFTWRWDGDDHVSAVRVELSPVDGGTLLILTHEGLPDEESRTNHLTGWSDCLDRLPTHLG